MKKLSVVPVAVLALSLGLGACGGSDDDEAEKPSGSPSASGAAAQPPKTIDPGQLNPGGGSGGSGGGGADTSSMTPAQKKQHQTLVKLAACMRKKGYQIDDPQPGAMGVAPKNPPDADKANKDSEECVKQANGS